MNLAHVLGTQAKKYGFSARRLGSENPVYIDG